MPVKNVLLIKKCYFIEPLMFLIYLSKICNCGIFKIGDYMKENNKYHYWDIINLTIFYSLFVCFIVTLILGIVDYTRGVLPLKEVLYRISFLILICVPYAIKKIFKVSFSRVVSIVYYIYLFLASFCGVCLKFYVRFECWDMIIHFLMGACLSVLSIYILNLTVYKKDRNKHNLFFTFLFMICFTLAIGVVWEFLEFGCDLIFDTGFQRYITYEGVTLVGQQALMDTMIDLLMDFAGAICGVIFTVVAMKVDKKFLQTFYVKKMKNQEVEVENIEE